MLLFEQDIVLQRGLEEPLPSEATVAFHRFHPVLWEMDSIDCNVPSGSNRFRTWRQLKRDEKILLND